MSDRIFNHYNNQELKQFINQQIYTPDGDDIYYAIEKDLSSIIEYYLNNNHSIKSIFNLYNGLLYDDYAKYNKKETLSSQRVRNRYFHKPSWPINTLKRRNKNNILKLLYSILPIERCIGECLICFDTKELVDLHDNVHEDKICCVCLSKISICPLCRKNM